MPCTDDLAQCSSSACYNYVENDCLIGSYVVSDTIDCYEVIGSYPFTVDTHTVPSYNASLSQVSSTLTLSGLKGSVSASCQNCPSGNIYLHMMMILSKMYSYTLFLHFIYSMLSTHV